MASVPWSYIQARGNPRFTAILTVVELPFYLVALWLLGGAYGLAGFAAAFALRGAADAAILLWRAGIADREDPQGAHRGAFGEGANAVGAGDEDCLHTVERHGHGREDDLR